MKCASTISSSCISYEETIKWGQIRIWFSQYYDIYVHFSMFLGEHAFFNSMKEVSTGNFYNKFRMCFSLNLVDLT